MWKYSLRFNIFSALWSFFLIYDDCVCMIRLLLLPLSQVGIVNENCFSNDLSDYVNVNKSQIKKGLGGKLGGMEWMCVSVYLTGEVCPWRSSGKQIWCFRGPDETLWAGTAGSVSSTLCSY